MKLELRLTDYGGSTLGTLVSLNVPRGRFPEVVAQDFGMNDWQVRQKVKKAQRLGIPVKDWRK